MVPRTVKTQQFGVLLSLSLDSVGVRSNFKMLENMHLLQKGEGKEFQDTTSVKSHTTLSMGQMMKIHMDKYAQLLQKDEAHEICT